MPGGIVVRPKEIGLCRWAWLTRHCGAGARTLKWSAPCFDEGPAIPRVASDRCSRAWGSAKSCSTPRPPRKMIAYRS